MMKIESLYDQFFETAKRFPNNLAILFERKRISYKKLNKLIDSAARRLISIGIRKGDVVTLALPNSIETVSIFYAISKIGAISYNIHPLSPVDNVIKMMKEANSKFLFVTGKESEDNYGKDIRAFAVNPYESSSKIKSFVFKMKAKKPTNSVYFSKIKPFCGVFPKTDVSENDDAVYLNTGGTDGKPKVVRLSNEAINHIGKNSYQLIGGPYESIRILTAIPLFHVFGLEMGVHTPLSFGGASVLMLRFRTKEAIRHIKKGDSTVILGVPSLYNALLARDSFYGKHLRKQITAFVGGDNVPESLLKRWNAAMRNNGSEAKLYQGYGLTEAGVVAVSTKGHDKNGSIGTELPGVKIKILDTATKIEKKNGESGEIAIGGPSLMNGYLTKSEANEDEFIHIDGERYFLTKDYGYCDEDGFNYFRQRIRRIVKINGETICPSEIEDVVLSLEDVFDAYCYGVSDARKGSKLRLLAVKRKGDHPISDEEAKKAITEKISSSLPSAYMPEKIFFIDRLPRTPIGKIDVKEIEKRKEFFD